MLGEAGFIVRDWGLGVNRGPGDNFDEWLDGLTENVADMRSQAGKKVSLIGWSLGGLFAREFAKRHPRQIKQVITLGTPLKDFDTGTHASGLFKLLNRGGEPVTPQMRRRLSESPAVPLTAIYSRNDGIKEWCIARANSHAESNHRIIDSFFPLPNLILFPITRAENICCGEGTATILYAVYRL